MLLLLLLPPVDFVFFNLLLLLLLLLLIGGGGSLLFVRDFFRFFNLCVRPIACSFIEILSGGPFLLLLVLLGRELDFDFDFGRA